MVESLERGVSEGEGGIIIPRSPNQHLSIAMILSQEPLAQAT
jgi:hypothetical protein